MTNNELDFDEVIYNQYLNAQFIERHEMVFFKNTKIKNFEKYLENHINFRKNDGSSKKDIEAEFNHIHMWFVTSSFAKPGFILPSLAEQKKYADKIVESWKRTLKKNFPNKKFIIEIVDEGGECVIYLYTQRENQGLTDVNGKTHKIVSREVI